MMISVRIPMLALPMLLGISISLAGIIDEKVGLTMSLHPFVLGQHTKYIRKALRAHRNRYNLITGGVVITMKDAFKICIPNSITLPTTFIMARVIISLT